MSERDDLEAELDRLADDATMATTAGRLRRVLAEVDAAAEREHNEFLDSLAEGEMEMLVLVCELGHIAIVFSAQQIERQLRGYFDDSEKASAEQIDPVAADRYTLAAIAVDLDSDRWAIHACSLEDPTTSVIWQSGYIEHWQIPGHLADDELIGIDGDESPA